MKFELKGPADLSDEALLDEIRKVASTASKPLAAAKFDANSKYSSSTIKKRFGGWLAALQKAGLDESFGYKDNFAITKETIAAELIRVSEQLGTKKFSATEFASISDVGSRNIFSKKFGSFGALMKEVGFTVPSSSRKYTDEERFENLFNVWTHYGRQPIRAEMKIPPSVVGPKAYMTRWGTWKKALIAFVERVNSDVSEEVEGSADDYNVKDSEQQKKKLRAEDRREVALGLRFAILKRDRYKCLRCGRTSATTLGIELHVDHIIPFSKGGRTREDNLRTLCNECNQGKGNQFE